MENAKMNSLIAQYPLVKDLVALKETTWFNPGTTSLAEGLPYVGEKFKPVCKVIILRMSPITPRTEPFSSVIE